MKPNPHWQQPTQSGSLKPGRWAEMTISLHTLSQWLVAGEYRVQSCENQTLAAFVSNADRFPKRSEPEHRAGQMQSESFIDGRLQATSLVTLTLSCQGKLPCDHCQCG